MSSAKQCAVVSVRFVFGFMYMLEVQKLIIWRDYYKVNYTVFQKKLHPFYFCNNFVDSRPIWIIFGRYVANEFSSGLQGLGYHAGLSVSDTDT